MYRKEIYDLLERLGRAKKRKRKTLVTASKIITDVLGLILCMLSYLFGWSDRQRL